MKLLKPLLKSQNYKDENEATLSLQWLLENSFASYLYAVLGYHIQLLPLL